MSAINRSTYAALPTTTRGQSVHLGGDPKNGKKFTYCCGNSVIIRDIDNPMIAETYNEHACATTVARFSPSGFYMASADVSGKVRVWDTVNAEHILKIEVKPIGGAILDMCWSEDSKRIAVCGQGRELFGHVFMWDTGSSLGEIGGHSKFINSIDFKQNRPYRIATASEDFSSGFYHGPPFKLNLKHVDHTRFAQCVRFAPDGSRYVTGGSDHKAYIYDGKTGEKVGLLGNGEGGHTGSIMSCSWSADSSKLLTASADRTCKLWDVAANKVVTTFEMGSEVEDQQLGCLWQGDHMISVALSGYISYLDVNNPSKPLRVLRGHNKKVTALGLSDDGSHFYTASYDGRMVNWDFSTGDNTVYGGKGHGTEITDLGLQGGNIYSVGKDDSVLSTPADGATFGSDTSKLDTQPIAIGVGKSSAKSAIVTMDSVEVVDGAKKVCSLKVSYGPLCVAMSPDGKEVAVGADDNKVYIYAFDGSKLTESKQLDKHRGIVTAIAYSPDGAYLASGDGSRNIIGWATAGWEAKAQGWCFHNGRVMTLDWSPNSKYVASGSVDSAVYVWSIEKTRRKIAIKRAHVGGVTRVKWVSDTLLLSAGSDGNVRSWDVQHH